MEKYLKQDSAMRLSQDGSEHFLQSTTREDEEFNDNCSSTSIASITSGCPIYPVSHFIFMLLQTV